MRRLSEQAKERQRLYSRAWYWRDPEKHRAKARERSNRRPTEERRATKKRWIANNPEAARLSSKKTKLKLLYGLTIEQYEALLAKQGHVCAICLSATAANKRGWYVDHCHTTKAVRGVLCHTCNTLLGCAKDDAATLERAAAYLKVPR